jgi:hypothetical protein
MCFSMWCGTRLYFLSLTPEYSRAGVEWLSDEDEEPDGQLYDLAVDPSEKNNLWDVKPGMVKALLSMLEVEKANAK